MMSGLRDTTGCFIVITYSLRTLRATTRYAYRVVYIRFIGTHRQYDAIGAAGGGVTGYPVAENFAEIACFV